MFTLIHVALSIVGIAAGFIVVGGMLSSKRLDGTTAVFLAATVLTNITAFGFPIGQVLPSHIVAALSLVTLAIALYARYAGGMTGHWRVTYVVSAVASLYFNVFVLIVQLFQKTPALQELAPTQSEAPFAVSQLIALGSFVAIGVGAARNFKPASVAVDHAFV